MKNLLTAAVGLACLTAAAQGAVTTYWTALSGAAEAPPNSSPGTGWARVDYDNVAKTMRVRAAFSNLIGTVTICHIHAATAAPFAGTAGVATPTPTFPGFPAGVTAGSYDATFDLTLASSWNAAFIAANGGTPGSAEIALFNAMNAGKAYFNLHTSSISSGEIRGFLTVPSPSALAMLGLGGLIASRRRR